MDNHAQINLWLSNDYPVYFAVRQVIERHHESPARSLTGTAQAVRYLVDDVFTGALDYRQMCKEVPEKLYPDGYPYRPAFFEETRDWVGVSGLFSVDWEQIVKDLNEDIDWD